MQLKINIFNCVIFNNVMFAGSNKIHPLLIAGLDQQRPQHNKYNSQFDLWLKIWQKSLISKPDGSYQASEGCWGRGMVYTGSHGHLHTIKHFNTLVQIYMSTEAHPLSVETSIENATLALQKGTATTSLHYLQHSRATCLQGCINAYVTGTRFGSLGHEKGLQSCCAEGIF